MTRWLWYIILLTGSMPAAHATSCSQLQPCAYIRPESAVFIGTVESLEALPTAQREGMMGFTHRIRLTVKEVFVGLPAGTKEITITGWEMRVRKDYLVNGWRGTDGKVGSRVCSNTHEADETDPYLRYLRLRQKGKAPTSLTASVYGATVMSSIGIADVEVVVRGPRGELRGNTDEMGTVVFKGIAPGEYTIAASKQNYRADSSRVQQNKVTVLDQACPSGYVHLRTDSSVSGVLRMPDGTGVSGVDLELVGIRPDRERRGYDGGSYRTMTRKSGEFRFDGVLPGRYLLGNGILFPTIATSRAPISYYPGRKSRAEAVEILVSADASVEGLQYTLVGTGAPRTIRIRVVDDQGQPVAGAKIHDRLWGRERSTEYSSLGYKLRTGTDGWLEVQGYENARYLIGASLLGASMAELRSTQAVEIRSRQGTGDGAVDVGAAASAHDEVPPRHDGR